MTWPEYRQSMEIAERDYSFYALIMAAMRKADPNNLEILKGGWPGVWQELHRRHKLPGGFLNEREAKEFE